MVSGCSVKHYFIWCKQFHIFLIEAKLSVDEKSDPTDASNVADKVWTDADKDMVVENPIETITQEDEDEDSTIASER